jgi:16S rRNA processing protein RimM
LIGCEVSEKDGTSIGIVRDVQIMGEQVNGTPILTVDSPQGELLIPLAQEICVRVDTEARTIEVVLPEGLRDLNRNS